MSLALKAIPTVRVYDPRTLIDNVRSWAILSGGKQFSAQPVVSTSYSTTSVQFTANPPSPYTIVDRKVYVKVSFTFTFTGSDLGTPLISLGTSDGLRCLPFQSCTDTLAVTFNNNSVNINSRDIIQCLLRYDANKLVEDQDLSLYPSMP